MEFTQQLQAATLVKRYKRFLADVELANGSVITVHCPNSGSMLGCSEPGSPVLISRSDNPRRKYAHTLEMVQAGSVWIGVNTSLTNRLVEEALAKGRVTEIGSIESIAREVKTSEHTRLDFLLTTGGRKTYLEVKNCSLAENGVALFPDAVTVRGAKHLRELMALRKEGHGAVVFFCVQRRDAESFSPAAVIDPEYAATLKEAHGQGVLVLAYQAEVSPAGIEIRRSLPVNL